MPGVELHKRRSGGSPALPRHAAPRLAGTRKRSRGAWSGLGTVLRWSLTCLMLAAAGWACVGVAVLTAPAPHFVATDQRPHGTLATDCTTLALDRTSGLTTAAPCARHAPAPAETLTARLGERVEP